MSFAAAICSMFSAGILPNFFFARLVSEAMPSLRSARLYPNHEKNSGHPGRKSCPERSRTGREIPLPYLKVLPRDSSTPKAFGARNDDASHCVVGGDIPSFADDCPGARGRPQRGRRGGSVARRNLAFAPDVFAPRGKSRRE